MARNIKIVVAYEGTHFRGWQVQPGEPTIQGSLAEALQRVTGEAILPQGSGRTDAGVHALAQVATFQTSSSIPSSNLVKALNSMLPTEIRVMTAEDVGEEFHARYSAKAKTYQYRIYRGGICPPFLADLVYHHPYPLNEEAMMKAAGMVVGVHDFTSFAAVDPEKQRNLEDNEGKTADHGRTVYLSEWRREAAELIYQVRGNGFLHHMVRNLVGTFLLVGKGTIEPEEITVILKARRRSAAGATAPASGLYLVSVEY